MPARVGPIISMDENGYVKATNAITGETHHGRLYVMSGGMVTFGLIDPREITVGAGERVEEAASPEQPEAPEGKPQRVAVGTTRR
jgi:hypothetical protein